MLQSSANYGIQPTYASLASTYNNQQSSSLEKVQSDSPSGTPTIASGPGQTGTSLEPVTGYESSLGVTGGSSQNPALIGSSPPNPIAATGTVQSNTMLASATASGAATDNTSASTP